MHAGDHLAMPRQDQRADARPHRPARRGVRGRIQGDAQQRAGRILGGDASPHRVRPPHPAATWAHQRAASAEAAAAVMPARRFRRAHARNGSAAARAFGPRTRPYSQVAPTTFDLDESEAVSAKHLAEAVQYGSLNRKPPHETFRDDSHADPRVRAGLLHSQAGRLSSLGGRRIPCTPRLARTRGSGNVAFSSGSADACPSAP